MKNLPSFKSIFLKKVWLAVVMILIIVALARLGVENAADNEATSSQEFTVNLTEEGFNPSEVKIKKGDRVKFTTTRDKHFWPASNLHPTHEIYSLFDPKKPVPAGESWVFQFDQVGEWKYHDHLSPYYKGIIKVEAENKNSSLNNTCQGNLNKQECWADAVEKAAREQGLNTAFDLIATIFSNEPNGAESCHNLVHRAGYAAFNLFNTNKQFDITPKASFCNYGFYHGFMEKLILSGEKLEKAGKFCDYIDSQLKVTAPNSGKQCYHGIGHGTVGNHVPELWGNEEKMISPAIKLCEEVSTNTDHLYRCVSGIYNGIGNFYVNSQFKLSVKKNDPFWVCGLQTNDLYANACYGNLHPTIAWISENNFARALSYVEKITDDKFALTAIRYVAGDFARLALNKDNFEQEISVCRNTQTRLKEPCITGLSTGLMDSGKPDSEYVVALEFCKSPALNQDEQNKCFDYSLQYLSTMYPKDKYQEVCQTVDKIFRVYCRV